MAKDPAFLFYSKDWLEGTAELTSEEKGVYVDLLAHQHQKGSLPPETKKLAKLSGLSEPEFIKIWSELSSKFIANASGRLVNRKLNGIVSERLDKGWRNKIIGTLGSIIRYSGLTKEMAYKVKQTFKVDDFLACTDENLSERLSEWYKKRYESIADANEDSICIPKGGSGEKDHSVDVSTWDQEKKNFFDDGAWQWKFSTSKNISIDDLTPFLQEFISDIELKRDYKDFRELERHFTNWYNLKRAKNGTHQQQSPKGGKSAGAIELAGKLSEKLAARGKTNP